MTSARAAGERDGAVRQLLPQQACRHVGVLSRRVCYQFHLSEQVQVKGIRRYYAAVVENLRNIRFDGDTSQRRGSIEQKGARRASWCKDQRVQVFLPQKKGHRKKRTQMMLFVMALVAGYGHLSRPSRAVPPL